MANRARALFDRGRDCGPKVALHFQGHSLTYLYLVEQVRAMAGALAALGVRRGSHAGILLPASPDFIIAQQALFALGAIITPLNTLHRPAEIVNAAAECDLDFLVTTRMAALEPLPCRVLLVDSEANEGACASIPAALRSSHPLAAPADVAAHDPAMHLLTSATTGRAKAVVLTNANLAANYDATPGWLGLGRDDVILCALPLYNTFGLNQCINAMIATGATMVLLPRFDAAQCAEACRRFGCTFLPAVPTMLQKIIDEPGAMQENLSALRLVMTGGAPVPSPLLRRLKNRLPDLRVLTGYGLSEGTALVTLTEVRLGSDGEIEHGRTIGRVLDGMDLSIRADDGSLCEPGEVGEIVVRGPNVMKGYYDAPEDTRSALRDGWLHTGDVGYVDGTGLAFIVDRKKDVIIRGGQNIYPAEIEDVLYRFDGVAEAAVVAREDAMLGEVPVAFVALSGACARSGEALLDHCRTELAKYKVPAAIEFLPELPKGPTGKILRRALRQVPESAGR